VKESFLAIDRLASPFCSREISVPRRVKAPMVRLGGQGQAFRKLAPASGERHVKRKQIESARIDELLLELLREDSRTSNTKIATRLGLSESAVRRRIDNLKASGRIRRFTVDVDDRDQSSAITWVSVDPAVPTRQVSEKIRGIRGVESVYETAGQFDIAVVVKGANIGEVNATIEGIRRAGGVTGTNTTMVLRTIR
jgi:Lrp/AsnC family transcriptional regulator, involved in the regulation of lysine biosynthesis